MTFEQIDCFIAAVHADTFFDAAELLHTTQSTLSKQIQKLEKELNLQLFDRSRRNAVLTPAGELSFMRLTAPNPSVWQDAVRCTCPS